ncbi:hypothetical protein BLA13014_08066 [Burkholderia aenigmatica]|uniref:Uncharacterized protein n=1 Tax=Burkholderia aenigmatica TaxID=2015348 RepID=A0A6P2T5T9_9BURK|nr:hypothetical protein BLA13014_08066 [Burkholderia aenigmatica]
MNIFDYAIKCKQETSIGCPQMTERAATTGASTLPLCSPAGSIAEFIGYRLPAPL